MFYKNIYVSILYYFKVWIKSVILSNSLKEFLILPCEQFFLASSSTPFMNFLFSICITRFYFFLSTTKFSFTFWFLELMILSPAMRHFSMASRHIFHHIIFFRISIMHFTNTLLCSFFDSYTSLIPVCIYILDFAAFKLRIYTIVCNNVPVYLFLIFTLLSKSTLNFTLFILSNLTLPCSLSLSLDKSRKWSISQSIPL